MILKWRPSQPEHSHTRGQAAESTGRNADDSPLALQIDEAIDTLAAFLRAFGRYSVGLSGTESSRFQQQCEAWARHILVCGPPPDEAQLQTALPPGQRSWARARQFVLSQRKLEHQRVLGSFTDFRQAIWAFVDGLSHGLTQDRETDEKVAAQLKGLKEVLNDRPTHDVRQAVEHAVRIMTELVEQRKQRVEARMSELGHTVSDLMDELQEVRRESSLDPLTRLFNRRPFEDYLNKTAYLRAVFGQPACLLLLDIDLFKDVNDFHGHPCGDSALQALADCLVRCFPRKSDLAARHGGDEFAVILSGTTQTEATRLADRFINAVRALQIEHEDQTIKLTVSVGVSEIEHGEPAEAWMRRTDDLLYEAKSRGRNCIVSGEAKPLIPSRPA